MIEFIQDDDRLREERKKAKKNKSKYVGLSNESMGFRSRGFDSNWQDRWPSSSRSPGGFRDSSPDFEDTSNNRAHSPDIDEFKDDDDDDFRNNTSPKEMPVQRSNSSGGSAAAGKSYSGATTKKIKVRKPIDLGAAATFAQQPQPPSNPPQQAKPPPQQSNVDLLFGGGEAAPTHASAGLDLTSDAFGPRETESNGGANGDFGDFSSAFGDGGKQQAVVASDEFADFSSAFNSDNAHQVDGERAAAADLLAALPAAPSVVDNTQKVASASTDLLGPSSSIDLLGGLDLSAFPAPAPAPAAAAEMSNPMMSLPTLLQPRANNDHHFGALAGVNNNNNNNNEDAVKKTGNMASTQQTALPQTWGTDLGKLNIDLDNLSLSGRDQKKKSVPMNAMMKTASASSGESPVISPTRTAQFGKSLPAAAGPHAIGGAGGNVQDLL